jgi:hypothetical protein
VCSEEKEEPAVLFTPETPDGFLCQKQNRPFPMLRSGLNQVQDFLDVIFATERKLADERKSRCIAVVSLGEN